ncbi:MAG: ornithine cyclodeaminase family protein [Firmicutes bacterium]|nr:ornithine cyclodeaminase family protein [Bacillota bacterium]
MKILVLNKADMQEVFNASKAIAADKEALSLYAAGKTNIPLRANLDIPEHNGQSLYMYGYAAPANALGVKIVCTYPDNINKGIPSVPANMVLQNAETGEVTCIMDGTYLTQVRTGAVAGLATDYLARKDAKVFAVFGTGGQAPGQIDAVLTVRPEIELVKLYDMNLERAAAFAEEMTAKFAGTFKAKFVAAQTAAEAVEGADIITTCTTAKVNVFGGTLVKKGCHINGVGSYTPEMSEIDEYIVVNADKVYTDTPDAVAESGDLIKPINKGTFSEDKITGQLGDLINGIIPGRESDDEITFFETVGSAVLDIVCGQAIYESAVEMGIGQVIEL